MLTEYIDRERTTIAILRDYRDAECYVIVIWASVKFIIHLILLSVRLIPQVVAAKLPAEIRHCPALLAHGFSLTVFVQLVHGCQNGKKAPARRSCTR